MNSLRKWLTRFPKDDPNTKKRVPQSHTNNTLSDVARGMQHAVNTTQEMMERHYIRQLDRYFEDDGSPTMVSFQVSPTERLEAPLITLTNQSGLSLDEMQVEMSIRVNEVDQKKSISPEVNTADELPFTLTRSSFSIDFAPPREHARNQAGVVDIVMNFKAGDPPEGVARVIEAFQGRIRTQHILPNEVNPENSK